MDFKYEVITITNDIGVHFLNKTYESNFVPKHWHNEIEIIYMLKGATEYVHNGQSTLVNEGDLIVFNSNEIHSATSLQTTEAILLQIPIKLLDMKLEEVNNLYFKCIPGTVFTQDQHAALKKLKKQLLNFSLLSRSQVQGYKLELTSIIYDLLFILVNQFGHYSSDFERQKSEKYFDRIEIIIKYVENHYQEEIDLRTISSVVGLNPEYFSRFFKKYMGISFLKYLNTVRLHHVHQDLLNTDYSITEILAKNGFSNYNIFSKLFKDTYGATPSQIRRQKR